MLLQPVHFLFAFYELHPFFSITAFSISLSRLKIRHQLLEPPVLILQLPQPLRLTPVIPPYFAFHAYTVCFDTPSSRRTSAVLRPASIYFSAPIISTSTYFLFAMPPPPTLRNLPFSYTPVRGKWGAGQSSPSLQTNSRTNSRSRRLSERKTDTKIRTSQSPSLLSFLPSSCQSEQIL
jgi:hypothetical protein